MKAIEKDWKPGKTTDEVYVQIKGTNKGICEVYGESETEALEIAEFIASAPKTKKQRDELLGLIKELYKESTVACDVNCLTPKGVNLKQRVETAIKSNSND